MFDKEIEAIAKCTELIKDLDEASRIRVIKYIIERFEIGASPMQSYAFIPNRQIVQPFLNHQEIEQQDYITVESRNEDYPSLKQLLIKNYPKNETEWILCYAFFVSRYGEDTFRKEDILEKYKENNRLTRSTSANLSNNIDSCINKDWIKDINKDEFILKPEGIEYAKEVLKGNSISKEIKRTKKTKVRAETND